MSYSYQGSGRDRLTRWMDRPGRIGAIAKSDSNTCRRCRRGYITRYHQEICRQEVLAEYQARGPGKRRVRSRRKCAKCGYDYRSKKHRMLCKGEE